MTLSEDKYLKFINIFPFTVSAVTSRLVLTFKQHLCSLNIECAPVVPCTLTHFHSITQLKVLCHSFRNFLLIQNNTLKNLTIPEF